MAVIRFGWDKEKALENQRKHGVSFEEASTCFVDSRALVLFDEKHGLPDELRWFLIGKSSQGRILTVRFTHRLLLIRIIGAGAWREGKIFYERKIGN